MAADLSFRIGAELTEIKGALAQLRGDFAKVGAAAQQSGNNTAFQGVERGAGRALGAIGRLVAGFATLAGAIALIGKADELNTLNARLKLVTNSTEEFNRAQTALFDLAQRTRSSLGDTITLYAKIAQATKDAGVGQETLLQVVETINQAVQLSGASAQAAEAALVQLGQGLGSGTLRGEELNSILEQTPALADAIAKGMGITRGELRKYGEEGKITAEQVVKALQAQKDEIASQFAQLPLTVGQSVTLLKNAGLQLLGAFDQTSESTAGLAEVIKGLADYLSSDEAIGAVVEFAATWSGAFRDIVNDAQDAADIIKQATADITGSGENLIDILTRAFRELPVNLRTVVRIVTVTFAGMVDSFIADAKLMKEAFAAIFTDDTIEAAIARRNARVNASLQAVKDSIDDALRDREAAIGDAKKAREASSTRRAAGRRDTGSNSLGTFKTKVDDKAAREAEALEKARLESSERLAKDSADRQVDILQGLYEEGLIAARDYYARREQIEIEGIDRSIEAQRKLSTIGSPADRQKALAEIELLERQKDDVRRRVLRESAKDRIDIERQLEQARAQELENRGQGADAARIRLEAQYRDLLRKLEAEGNTAGVKIIRGLIDTGVAKAQFDELQREFERVTGDLQRRQAQIADQVRSGALTPDVAQQQTTQARADAITQLDALNAKMRALAETTNDPAIIAGAQRVADALRDMAADSLTGIDAAVANLRASLANMQASFEQSLTGAGVDALTTLFTDLASGSKSAGDAIKDFARSFVASMAQIAARALATYLVLQLLDAVFPGAGKLVAASGNLAANVKHGGGMAGQGTRRQVNPLVFAGAPRFHEGSGVLGLKPGEIPAILQEGERVQSREEVRSGGQGGGGNGYRIVNVLDPSLVAAHLESAAGERAILNVISRNPAQVRQTIGT